MGEVELVVLALQQLGQPFPAVGRLKCDPRFAVEPREQLQERLGSLTIRRERCRSASSPITATCERLRCRSMPTEFISGPHGPEDLCAPEAYRLRAPGC